jgi:hypothetical protein
MGNLENYLESFLLNNNIIPPRLLNDLRLLILMKHKYVGRVDLSCDSNTLKINITLYLKWWHFLKNKKHLERFIHEYVGYLIPSALFIEGESRGLESFNFKSYEVSIEYKR